MAKAKAARNAPKKIQKAREKPVEPPQATPDFEVVPVDTLHDDPANARTHGEDNLAAIEASLREFGQVEPLVAQRGTGKVIGGNGRLLVMRRLGWATAKVTWVDLNDARAAALGIALNRTGELAGWDEAALNAALAELEVTTPDLQKMLADLAAEHPPKAGGEASPPEGFPEYGENIATEHKCPKCGYEWSGQPK